MSPVRALDLFFSYCYADHRDLHSFPTRRSSDLPLFSNYRQVPWLIRSHAVTVLPSVSALATLRRLPPGDPGRRPFIGFGDPFFSREQAADATREAEPARLAALSAGDQPVALRASPKTERLNISRLAMLPWLPDTADEIRSIAVALNADL